MEQVKQPVENFKPIKTRNKKPVNPKIRAIYLDVQQGMSFKDAMVKQGYSENTAKNPKTLTESKTWQALLNEISDIELLDRLKDIALDRTDKRAALEGIKMTFQLKDRFPAGKLKIQAVNEERSQVFE